MKYPELLKLRQKLFFTVEDVSNLLSIKTQSARVLCSRYTKKGVFIRAKKDFYVLEQSWQGFLREDFFRISNYLQVPSYISFLSALSFYEVTTQVQQSFFESASIKRTTRISVRDSKFNFSKLKREYYFGFVKNRGVFIATKEKAFLDATYLYSLGKYELDFNALDLSKLDNRKIEALIPIFPQKTRSIVRKTCRI